MRWGNQKESGLQRMELGPGRPESRRALRLARAWLTVSGSSNEEPSARCGHECPPFLPSPHFREDTPGFEAKDDSPMSAEELRSQVKKLVRMGAPRGWGRPFPGTLTRLPHSWRRGSRRGSSS